MTEVLQRLANLQFIDARLDELNKLRGDLPEEILDMETDIARYQGRVKQLSGKLIDIEQERKTLETEIVDAEALIKKYEEQQVIVRNNREYDALSKEIDSQRQTIENSRSRLEELKYLETDAKAELATSEERLTELQGSYAEKKENLTVLIARNATEEQALIAKREEAAKEVEERYLRSYERLRNGLTNKVAVVALDKKGACMGMMLPPQVQMEVRKKNKIVIDEHSGRIVIDPWFFEEAERTFKL